MQTLATTRNIVGPNNVVSCCAMLADVCKRSQQVATCWVFRWEDKGLWDVFHLGHHFYFLFACICVDTWHVLRVHWRNIVGCAVQTNTTLLDHASMIAKQQKCWHLFRETLRDLSLSRHVRRFKFYVASENIRVFCKKVFSVDTFCYDSLLRLCLFHRFPLGNRVFRSFWSFSFTESLRT